MICCVPIPVSVSLLYDHKKRRTCPVAFKLHGEVKKVKIVDLHHSYRVGCTLYHVFSVTTGGAFFKLVLNTDNLFWQVEEVVCE